MIHLLGTSAVLAHARKEAGAARVQELFEREDSKVLLCVVTLAELARRFRELGAKPDEAWETIDGYRQLVDGFVAVDESVARESDRILIETPSRIPLVDALIAAAAKTSGAVLVHRDAHMSSIPPGTVVQLDLAADGGR
jgi:predicted nucleic acid-binding protein